MTLAQVVLLDRAFDDLLAHSAPPDGGPGVGSIEAQMIAAARRAG